MNSVLFIQILLQEKMVLEVNENDPPPSWSLRARQPQIGKYHLCHSLGLKLPYEKVNVSVLCGSSLRSSCFLLVKNQNLRSNLGPSWTLGILSSPEHHYILSLPLLKDHPCRSPLLEADTFSDSMRQHSRVCPLL